MIKAIMSDNKRSILAEIKTHKGEIGLYGLELIKLIGFKEDEDDYYYYAQGLQHDGEPMWYSAVGRVVWLKPLPKKEYAEIERMFNLNCRPLTNVEKLAAGFYNTEEKK